MEIVKGDGEGGELGDGGEACPRPEPSQDGEHDFGNEWFISDVVFVGEGDEGEEGSMEKEDGDDGGIGELKADIEKQTGTEKEEQKG